MPASSTSITATVDPAGDPAGVDHYIVQIENDTGKKCKATPAELSCSITVPSPATQYTVQVMACLVEGSSPNQCSPVKVGGQSWTRPSREDTTLIEMDLSITMFTMTLYFC